VECPKQSPTGKPGWLSYVVKRPNGSAVTNLPLATRVWLYIRSHSVPVRQKIASLYRLVIEGELDKYRAILMGQAAQTEPVNLLHDLLQAIVDEYNTRQALSRSQEEVVKSYIQTLPNGIGVIQGPPGCRKTTLIATIATLRVLNQKQTLICAPSNFAVDRIIEALVNKKLGRNDGQKAIIIHVHASYTEKFEIATQSNLAAPAGPATQIPKDNPVPHAQSDQTRDEDQDAVNLVDELVDSQKSSQSQGDGNGESPASQPNKSTAHTNDSIDEAVEDALLKMTHQDLSLADSFAPTKDKRFQKQDVSLSAWMLKVAGIIDDQTINPQERWAEFRRLYHLGIKQMTDEDRTSY
jgi:hypothetical protein